MSVTIAEILDLELVVNSRPDVLAGDGGLNAVVRWVHVSELERIGSLIRGGELVLTTGMALTAPADRAVAYLVSLVDAGACGLVVELGTLIDAVPASVVAAARNRSFPLIVLGKEIRFVELTEIVHQRIVGEQYSNIEFSRDVHEVFTALSLENAPADVIVERAARMCRASVVLEDLGHKVLAYSASGDAPEDLLADWEHRSRLSVEQGSGRDLGGETWQTTPVGLSGHHWGRLVVPIPNDRELPVRMVLERAAQTLELGRMVERDRISLTFQAQGSLLGDLAAGAVKSETEALTRASAVGVKAAALYIPLVIRIASARDAAALTLQRRTRQLAELAAKEAADLGISSLIGLWGEIEVAVILGVPRKVREDVALEKFALALAGGGRPNESGAGRVIGVGPADSTLSAAASSIREAAHAAEVAGSMRHRSPQLYYRTSELRIRGLMSLLAEDSRIQAFVESELQKLLAYEAAHGEGLLELLRQFLHTGGNKSELARLAHLSRPALYSRLDKLERILDVDLSDVESRLSLYVALVGYEQRTALYVR
ncbi:purine catabolism regulator [Rhodococcus sp. 27YEA15]|uniref:PucR family transcriptional regulator n=1 Tax=Rhodococcus sp. 27YEA15 TaxID=3156259 RepID=UPI003C7A3545